MTNTILLYTIPCFLMCLCNKERVVGGLIEQLCHQTLIPSMYQGHHIGRHCSVGTAYCPPVIGMAAEQVSKGFNL